MSICLVEILQNSALLYLSSQFCVHVSSLKVTMENIQTTEIANVAHQGFISCFIDHLDQMLGKPLFLCIKLLFTKTGVLLDLTYEPKVPDP